MNASTSNSPSAFISLFVSFSAVIAGACTVGPYQAVSNEAPYSAQVGAEYRVIVDDLHAYGVYAALTDKRDGKPISSITLIPWHWERWSGNCVDKIHPQGKRGQDPQRMASRAAVRRSKLLSRSG